MYEISVLGPLEVRRDGAPVPVPGGKTAELLVRLALEAGTAVRADRLLDDLWAGAPTSRNTLQQKVTRLRRALPGLVERTDAGYRLAMDPGAVDALAGADARRPLPEALLPDAGDWAAPYRARLADAHLAATEARLARLMEEGGDVIPELEAAVAAAPYREGLWELLVTALYRAGRQADALAAHRRARERLREDLGLEPGPALRALERRVLAQDAGLGGAGGNLPPAGEALVGRDAAGRAVRELLDAHRIVVVTGPGGVGKTALAIAVGHALPDGVWLARLEGARTADEVLDTVLAALAVTGGEHALAERLRHVPATLILDNCEHVRDAAASLAERLLAAAPALRILATSQVPLDVDGDAVHDLAPLPPDDAAALFVRRAARPGDAGDVLELCCALDGLPLAIELAAARTRTLPLAEITRRLDDRFAVLSDPASRRPERRRALRAAIGWSYDLLFPDDQRGLWGLAAFADGAPLAAAESVLDALGVPAPAAMDVVARLVSRSLVIVDDPPRYRLLDSIRAFGLEAAGDAREAAFAAHAAWYAARAAESTDGVRGARQAAHLALARVERANIDAALARCGPRRALDIATGFGWAWIVLGDARGAQRLLAALGAAPDAPARQRATALLLAGWIEASSGDLGPARRHVLEATTLAAGDPLLEARCAYHLAYVVSHHGDWLEALALTDRARALLDGPDHPWDRAANALFASRAAISAGDVARARAARDEVVACLRTVDDPWLHVRCDAMLGELARVECRFTDAVEHIARAAETSGRLGFQQTEAYQLTSLGRARCQAGDYPSGAEDLRHGIAKAEATGDVRLAALGRVHLGRVLRALGRDEEARAALEAASAFHRGAGGGEQEALGETLLAAMDGDRDRLAELLAGAHGAPVEVFALDALGRHDEADRRMPQAAHFITERDRVDRPAG